MASFASQISFRRLGDVLMRGRREADQYGSPLLVSVTTAIPSLDPVALFGRAQGRERILWEQPSQEFSLVGLGVAVRLTSCRAQRFSQLSAAWNTLRSRSVVDAPPACPLPGPVGLSGLTFDPARRPDPVWEGYPDALLLIPRFLVLSYAGTTWLMVNIQVAPGDDTAAAAKRVADDWRNLLLASSNPPALCAPPFDKGGEGGFVDGDNGAQAEEWKETVTAILRDIGAKQVEKVVLARQVRMRLSQCVDLEAVVRRLRSGYGNCTIFAFAWNERCFVGATPERLVRLDGCRVRADCLAGSTARGATETEDRILGDGLLANSKERHEHALVVRTLREALAPLCTRLTIPDLPVLLRMSNVQHLHTPVTGMMQEKGDLLLLVERLHPTPACGGLPRKSALELLRTYERFDRGWYASPVGWIDGRGNGEFVVAIRSALLVGNTAVLHAGCGIVAGSDPEQEYQESCWKLKPMLWALSGERQ